jgi:phosphate transport system permease protein
VTTAGLDPRHDITVRSGRLEHRKRVEQAMAVLAVLSALLACAILFIVLGSVLSKGISQLDASFFTKPKPLFGQKGGIADALVGSALIIGMAIVFSVPLAVLVAVYVSEYARPRAALVFRLVLDVLNGIPAIVVGIFIFGLLVVGHGQSAVYGAVSLAILMLPMVSRATQEVLALVPRSLREASLALGVPRWRTVYSIVLPTAIGGILTGVVLAVARVAGETAPILFTSSLAGNTISTDVSHALSSLPLAIFTFSESPDPNDQAAGWAAALVLIAFVLVLNVLAKTVAARKRRASGGSMA